LHHFDAIHSAFAYFDALFLQLVQDGDTALMSAASNGHTETVKVLHQLGADVNAQNDVSSELFAISFTCDVCIEGLHVSESLRSRNCASILGGLFRTGGPH
jgi:ankyrin repeat protein